MSEMTRFGRVLLHNKPAQVGEIVALFGVTLAVIVFAMPLAGENPVASQGVVCLT